MGPGCEAAVPAGAASALAVPGVAGAAAAGVCALEPPPARQSAISAANPSEMARRTGKLPVRLDGHSLVLAPARENAARSRDQVVQRQGVEPKRNDVAASWQ